MNWDNSKKVLVFVVLVLTFMVGVLFAKINTLETRLGLTEKYVIELGDEIIDLQKDHISTLKNLKWIMENYQSKEIKR